MAEKPRPRPKREGGPPKRPGGGGAPPRRPSFRAPESGMDELLEIADELEEQARDILGQVRRLQRIAQRLEGGGGGGGGGGSERRPSGPPRDRPFGGRSTGERPAAAEGGRPPRGRPGESRRPPRDEEERGEKPKRGGGGRPGAPAWVPQGKKKRS